MMREVTINELTPVITHDPAGILVCGGHPAKAVELQRREAIMSQEGWNCRSQHEDNKLIEAHLSGRAPLVLLGKRASEPDTPGG
eukprot:10506545-Alexandrium_andersonii.AAC.1